ncbi:hypothetical protein CMV_000934 [Castanea mollissima]|uniref:Uncharacterized protein n=1 Tax=Castanea mollissima TaxID=60419 RepID=A0A8J4RSF1_9ROSI|nr:hypothetical protein CMV_000934 [Castanea mollissima]
MPLEPLCTVVATLKFGEEPSDSHKIFAAFIDTLVGLMVVTAADQCLLRHFQKKKKRTLKKGKQLRPTPLAYDLKIQVSKKTSKASRIPHNLVAEQFVLVEI